MGEHGGCGAAAVFAEEVEGAEPASAQALPYLDDEAHYMELDPDAFTFSSMQIFTDDGEDLRVGGQRIFELDAYVSATDAVQRETLAASGREPSDQVFMVFEMGYTVKSDNPNLAHAYDENVVGGPAPGVAQLRATMAGQEAVAYIEVVDYGFNLNAGLEDPIVVADGTAVTGRAGDAGVPILGGTDDYGDGFPIAVLWDNVDAGSYQNFDGGTYTYTGHVLLTGQPVSYTVTFDRVDPVRTDITDVTTPNGSAPTMPETGLIMWDNGTVEEGCTVVWHPDDLLTAAEYGDPVGGVHPVTGHIASAFSERDITGVSLVTVESAATGPSGGGSSTGGTDTRPSKGALAATGDVSLVPVVAAVAVGVLLVAGGAALVVRTRWGPRA